MKPVTMFSQTGIRQIVRLEALFPFKVCIGLISESDNKKKKAGPGPGVSVRKVIPVRGIESQPANEKCIGENACRKLYTFQRRGDSKRLVHHIPYPDTYE